jgi:hypothetical protein
LTKEKKNICNSPLGWLCGVLCFATKKEKGVGQFAINKKPSPVYETRIQSSFKLFILRLIAQRHAFAPG